MDRKSSFVICLIIAIGLFLWGGWSAMKVKTYSNGIKATAAVVGYKETRGLERFHIGRGRHMVSYYNPVVEFTTNKGEKIHTTYKNFSQFMNYSIGQKVQVIYKVNDPTKVIVGTVKGHLVMPFIVISIGVLFLICSICNGISVLRDRYYYS